MTTPILDPCCGSRMFHFNKKNPLVTYGDCRQEEHILCDGRLLIIEPDVILDFRNLPYSDESFYQVIFDPPHLVRIGQKAYMSKKYGRLSEQSWEEDIKKGFSECFRVLKTNGTLIFKWNETQIPTKDILALTDYQPIVGHISGKRSNTHWFCFLKDK